MLDALIVLLSVVVGGVLLHPRLAKARLWQATMTPLASIIGSGFLILGPVLNMTYGVYAPLAMGCLCLGAYLYGSAIRFNIAAQDRVAAPIQHWLETAASWALAFAYVISVAYYLNLLGSFAVSLTDFTDPFHARLVTSGVFAVILIVGWLRGFAALEALEQITVGLKLSIIAGLLLGLVWYLARQAANDALQVNPPHVQGWAALTLIFGLVITMQGFETSRYLDEEYDAATRIRSMRLAQWLSSGIYMVYILLLTFAFPPDATVLSETAIIGVMAQVAPILPALLVAAALSAMFSAAVADTGGSGGLIHELSGGRITPRVAYAILVMVGLWLTWAMSVFEIIGYASRAFAIYYGIQALIAARNALAQKDHAGRALLYAGLTGLAIAMALLGTGVA